MQPVLQPEAKTKIVCCRSLAVCRHSSGRTTPHSAHLGMPLGTGNKQGLDRKKDTIGYVCHLNYRAQVPAKTFLESLHTFLKLLAQA